MSTTSPVTSFDVAVSPPCSCSCATASGDNANAPMSVAVTAIFISVGLLFVALNMKQCERLSALVNCSRFAVRSATLAFAANPTTTPIGRRLQVLVNQLSELIEKVSGVMRPGCSFGMILHTEDRQFLVAHSLDCAVVQVDVGHFNLGGSDAASTAKP